MNNRRNNTAAALTAAAMLLAGRGAFATLSEPALVDSDLRSAHWTTVFTNAVPLAWEWGTNATYAKLDIVGMNGAVTTNLYKNATSNWLWQAFAPGVPAAEDVYDLTLTFYTDTDVLAGALTARLAVVTGAFGAAEVNAVSNSPAWTKVKDNAVIPYDAAFSAAATNAVSAQLVIAKQGGATQTNAFPDVAGYFGWKVRNGGWGSGTFDLSLTFPPSGAAALTAELTRSSDGTMVRVR